MKNVYFILLLLGCISSKSYSQGVDVIFWIDYSNSMSSNERGDIWTTVPNLVTNVLACNADNRAVAVIHSYNMFGASGTIYERPRISVATSGFSNSVLPFSAGFAQNWGYSYACLPLLKEVLLGTFTEPYPPPYAPGEDLEMVYGLETLTRTPGNQLIVVYITDGGGYVPDELVPHNSSGNWRYAQYTDFKNTFDAKLAVILGPVGSEGIDLITQTIAAGIASRTGDYYDGVDYYSDDPSGPGLTGRKLLVVGNDPVYPNDANFLLNASQLQAFTEYICVESPIVCHSTLDILSPDYDVVENQEQNRQASISISAYNKIYDGGTAIYHAEEAVVLKPGFHGMNGSKFRGYIEGCSGEFVGRMAPVSDKEQTFDFSEITIEDKQETQILFLSPNPTSSLVTVTSTKTIRTLSVASLDGKVMFNADLGGKANYQLDVSRYTPGYYSVTITTDDGEIYTEKLIKN